MVRCLDPGSLIWVIPAKMYIGGEWVDRDDKIQVVNPYNSSVIDTVPRAGLEDVDSALASAERGAAVMAKVPGYERFLMLRKAADLLEERTEDFARTITMEEGKVIGEGRTEVSRAVQTISLSGEEAKRLYGADHPTGRRAVLDRTVRFYHSSAVRSGGGHQPL